MRIISGPRVRSGAWSRFSPATARARPAGWVPPYTLPGSGQAVFIGTNTANDIRPNSHSTTDWSYSLFNAYGSGVFVESYSQAGAFVIACSGGHQAPPNVDAAIFDFSNATWSRLPNANGIAPRNTDYAENETTGAPEWELLGSTPANSVSAPAHLYFLAVGLPGGSNGRYMIATPTGLTTTGQGTSLRARVMDLSSGAWSRGSVNRVDDAVTWSASSVNEGNAVYDPVTGRVYLFPIEVVYLTHLPYLDLSDNTWKGVAMSNLQSQSDQQRVCWLDPQRRLILIWTSTNALRCIDLNNLSAGIQTLTVSGTFPTVQTRWAYYPPADRFYLHNGETANNTLFRLTPPAGNPLTGTWTVDSITVSGVTLPQQEQAGGGLKHYTRFFYVPAIECLAWIAGGSTQVAIMRP